MTYSLDKYSKIRGSYRSSAYLPGSHLVGDVDRTEYIEVTVSIRPKSLSELEARIYDMNNLLPIERRYLTLDELQSLHAPSPDELNKIESFAQSHGLVIVEANMLKRAVVLGGTVASLTSAFRTELKRYAYRRSTYLGRKGWIYVPTYLASIVQGVHGLDNRPQFTPSIYRSLSGNKSDKDNQDKLYAHLLTPAQVSKIYKFPTVDSKGTKLDGSGQSIAIIELSGGFYLEEIKMYFEKLGIPMPDISYISIGSGKNNPGFDNYADGEVMIDICIVGAIAPRAKIVVYFSDLSTKGLFSAITQAVHDRQHSHSIICISWGGAEGSGWSQWMSAVNQSFLDAAALGQTVICASGDHGSSDLRPYDEEMIDDSLAHVEFPASSPFVLSCGGTELISPNTANNYNEIAWNDGKDGITGGGVSEYFTRPPYQVGTKIPRPFNKRQIDGRGVPDVSGVASPGYNIPLHGQEDPKGRGGTSAVVPLWAGLIALINQSIGKPIGFINPLLYKHPAFIGVLSDIRKGYNGVKNVKVARKGKTNVKGYRAHNGWDACTGLGTPHGEKLLNALTG
jgi:kumamolisin